MATVNLGRIKPVWQGTWDNSTQYIADDIVYYNNSAWVAVATNTNSAPADGNANWDKMAQGSDIPTQSGNSGKVLKTDGSALSWGDGGKVLQTLIGAASGNTYSSVALNVRSNYDTLGSDHITITMTPESSTSIIVIHASATSGVADNGFGAAGIYAGSTCIMSVNGNGYSADAGAGGMSAYHINHTAGSAITFRYRAIGGWGGSDGIQLGSRRTGGTGYLYAGDNRVKGTMIVTEMEP